MLSYILVDNNQCKELVLRYYTTHTLPPKQRKRASKLNVSYCKRIPLEIPKADGPFINLLSKSMITLMENLNSKHGNPLLSVGLLRLLCTWLYECPQAVKAFMASAQNIPFVSFPLPPPTLMCG